MSKRRPFHTPFLKAPTDNKRKSLARPTTASTPKRSKPTIPPSTQPTPPADESPAADVTTPAARVVSALDEVTLEQLAASDCTSVASQILKNTINSLCLPSHDDPTAMRAEYHRRLKRMLSSRVNSTSTPPIIDEPLHIMTISDEEIRDIGEDIEGEVTLLNIVAQSNSALDRHTPVLSKGLTKYRKLLLTYDQQETPPPRLDLTTAEGREFLLSRMQYRMQTLRECLRPFLVEVVQQRREVRHYSLGITVTGRSFRGDPLGIQRRDYVSALSTAVDALLFGDGGQRVMECFEFLPPGDHEQHWRHVLSRVYCAFAAETGPVMGKEHIHARVSFCTNSFVHLLIEKLRLFLVSTMNTRLQQLDSSLPPVKNLYIFLDARSTPVPQPVLVSPVLLNDLAPDADALTTYIRKTMPTIHHEASQLCQAQRDFIVDQVQRFVSAWPCPVDPSHNLILKDLAINCPSCGTLTNLNNFEAMVISGEQSLFGSVFKTENNTHRTDLPLDQVTSTRPDWPPPRSSPPYQLDPGRVRMETNLPFAKRLRSSRWNSRYSTLLSMVRAYQRDFPNNDILFLTKRVSNKGRKIEYFPDIPHHELLEQVDLQQLQNLYCLLRGVGLFPQLSARPANTPTKNETNRRMPIVSKAEELVKFFGGTIYILVVTRSKGLSTVTPHEYCFTGRGDGNAVCITAPNDELQEFISALGDVEAEMKDRTVCDGPTREQLQADAGPADGDVEVEMHEMIVADYSAREQLHADATPWDAHEDLALLDGILDGFLSEGDTRALLDGILDSFLSEGDTRTCPSSPGRAPPHDVTHPDEEISWSELLSLLEEDPLHWPC